jgi:hypothetical protein
MFATQFKMFCLSTANLTRKDENIKHFNFACSFVWVWNFVKLRDEHVLGVCDNWVLRRIFRAEWDDVKGAWRLDNKVLSILYFSLNIRMIK